MSELYICIDCELANANADPITLDKHGMCSRCGSSSVVPLDTMTRVALKARSTSLDEALRTPTQSTTLRVDAMRAQRAKDNARVRDYLRSLMYPTEAPDFSASALRVLNEQLADALAKWDGWSWTVYYPWAIRDDEELNPFPGKWVVELSSGTKGGPVWFIIVDDSLNEVKSFPNGTD